MKIAIDAIATEKVRFFGIFDRTYRQPVRFEETLPDTGSVARKITDSPFPIYVTLAYSMGVVTVGLRLAGFDVPLKTVKVYGASVLAIEWSWRGLGLRGTLTLGA